MLTTRSASAGPGTGPLPVDAVMADLVVRPIEEFAGRSAGAGLVRTAFLTGSYVSGHWNRRGPNLNVYFIAEAGRAADLRLETARLWTGVRAALAPHGRTLHVDCHPFTLSMRPEVHHTGRTITVTSKVLEGEQQANRYRLPPTIGPGWAANFRLITGVAEDLDCLREHPRRDTGWIRTVHRALSHYRNVLDHLPWAVDWQHAPAPLAVESARYAEEALKDALALALTADELHAGKHIVILSDWAATARPFITERFGAEGLRAADRVAELKRCAERADDLTPEEAVQAWRSAQRVMAWAWARFVPVADEICPDAADLARVDAFL
ncbi:hypothetical protein AB0K43_16995 [Kitasatospora sp. NPDC049258]|uniref:hypothetical protein n=1 Tax=Kitasatospora sp. NPDC049258 TaxID=3155394 RepID=UPI003416E3FB